MINQKNLLIPNGGLGDSLQFSTLPEEFVRQKKVKVFISKKSIFRNKEIYKLVWKLNPFISGLTSEVSNAGLLDSSIYKKRYNVVENAEVTNGLKIKNKFPKIYYKPKKIKLKKFFLVDLSGTSLFYRDDELKIIKNIVGKLRKKYKKYSFLTVRFKKKISKTKKLNLYQKIKSQIKKKFFQNSILSFGDNKHFSYNIALDDTVFLNSIFEYCDYINSASGFISLHHGQSHLSSAIKSQYNKKLKSYCILQKRIYEFHNSGGHGKYLFQNIKYIKF